MTKETSGCTLASLLRGRQSVLANFADTDEAADDADMHDAAQHAAVAADRANRGQRRHAEAIDGLGRGKADSLRTLYHACVMADEVPMRLAEAEAAAAQPVESGSRTRHDFLDPRLRRK